VLVILPFESQLKILSPHSKSIEGVCSPLLGNSWVAYCAKVLVVFPFESQLKFLSPHSKSIEGFVVLFLGIVGLLTVLKY
jgi:hypothetical protein